MSCVEIPQVSLSLSPWPPSGSAMGCRGGGFTAEGAVCWIPPNQIRPKYDMVGCSHLQTIPIITKQKHGVSPWNPCILYDFIPLMFNIAMEKTITPPWKSPWNRHKGPTSSRWKMPAASAASASPTARASSKCSGAASAAAGDHRQRASGLHLEATLRSPRSWEITLVTLVINM